MIDWFRGEIPFYHDPLPAGHVLSIDPDGSLLWDCVKSLDCLGSYESNIRLRSSGGDGTGSGQATSLLIDGNLCKFLQGHNIFGIRDLNRLVYLSFKKIIESYPEHFQSNSSIDLTLQKIKRGDYLVKMLDINQLYDIGNDASVEAWLHAAEMRARTRTGRSTSDRGTVYLQKTSRRWAFKFYNKHRELLARSKGHKLPDELKDQGLEDFIFGKLRAELRLMSLELKDLGFTHGHHFTIQNIDNLFNTYIRRINMNTQATLIDKKLCDLPRSVQATYQLHRQGVSLKNMLPMNTFYRHRRILLEHGVDISMPPESIEHSNVVPLIRIIEAVPVQIPSWAYERNLIAC